MYAMVQYYLLYHKAAYQAKEWYLHNYTKFLYPKANLASPRISEFLEALGSAENRRAYLLAHIPYLLKSTNDELCILVDSTGMPNKCDLEYTRVSVHEGEVSIEFRVIVVVQKSTGLPVYYEMIAGNVVDVSTIQSYHVEYSIGDAAYSCPAVLERLVLSGIDFMTRLNPTYDTYKDVVKRHLEDLDDKGKSVLFHGRQVRIFRCETVIATEKETGKEMTGNIYLCRDINSWHSKSNHLLSSKKAKSMTTEERDQECKRFGLFALVTTIDMKEEGVLKEYYTRQAIEQFFDYGKNYANYMPVRCHKKETVSGHLLLSFVATFILVLIKNKLNILDSPYARIPLSLVEEADDEEIIRVDNGDGTDIEVLVDQDPLMGIFQASPAALFGELQFQKAEVFPKQIVPSVPTAAAGDIYRAYHLASPLTIHWNEAEGESTYEFRLGEGNHCTRRIAFSRRSTATDEKILQAREKKAREKAAQLKTYLGENEEQETPQEKPKRGRGRPPGAKNKKTLAREADLAQLQSEGKAEPKRGRGRPPGSKNKKTLEKEAAERARQEAEANKPRRRGRPLGSKNKKTLAREAKATQETTSS